MDKPATSPPDSTHAPRGAEASDLPAAQARAAVSQPDAPGGAGSAGSACGEEDARPAAADGGLGPADSGGDEDDEDDEYVPL
jgi:hypothetical protein